LQGGGAQGFVVVDAFVIGPAFEIGQPVYPCVPLP
jgi:hypothetical protein